MIDVCLLNGRAVSLPISEDTRVSEVKVAAQQQFGLPFLRLTKGGRCLAPSSSLRNAEVRPGDTLQAVAEAARLAATQSAFAVFTGGGVATWGDPDEGGDSDFVQGELQGVRLIRGAGGAFAAVCDGKELGAVVAWGDWDAGGDCFWVREQLTDVQDISASKSAFAALRADGTVVTWGDPDAGGDSSGVQSQLRDVQQVCASSRAFAALIEGWRWRQNALNAVRVPG